MMIVNAKNSGIDKVIYGFRNFTISRATILIIFIIGFMAGPAVSL